MATMSRFLASNRATILTDELALHGIGLEQDERAVRHGASRLSRAAAAAVGGVVAQHTARFVARSGQTIWANSVDALRWQKPSGPLRLCTGCRTRGSASSTIGVLHSATAGRSDIVKRNNVVAAKFGRRQRELRRRNCAGCRCRCHEYNVELVRTQAPTTSP